MEHPFPDLQLGLARSPACFHPNPHTECPPHYSRGLVGGTYCHLPISFSSSSHSFDWKRKKGVDQKRAYEREESGGFRATLAHHSPLSVLFHPSFPIQRMGGAETGASLGEHLVHHLRHRGCVCLGLALAEEQKSPLPL